MIILYYTVIEPAVLLHSHTACISQLDVSFVPVTLFFSRLIVEYLNY